MPIRTNAIITAMLQNDLTDIDTLFKTTDTVLEAITPATKSLLNKLGYHSDETKSDADIFISFAYRWQENSMGSRHRAIILTRVLDTYYHLSPTLYFTHLLQIAKLTAATLIRLNQSNDNPYHQAIKVVSPGLATLAEELNDRIRSKKLPREALIAFASEREAQNNPLKLTDLPDTTSQNSRLKSEELSALTTLIQPNTKENRESALKALLPNLWLDESETTLYSSIMQRIIFNFEDVKRPLGTSNLDIAYTAVNAMRYGKPQFYPAIPESLLLAYFQPNDQSHASTEALLQHNPLLHEVNSRPRMQNGDSLDERKASLETRLDILKRYFKNETDRFNTHKMALYAHYTHGKHIRITADDGRRKSIHQTLVYPNWFIETMLKSFKIDINLPLNEGDAPIVDWFKSKSPSVFKHLLNINGVIPCNENVDIIIEFIAQQLKDHPTKKERLTDKGKSLLTKINDHHAKEAFIAQMQAIGLFKKPVVEIPAIALQATAPTSAPDVNVTELIVYAIVQNNYNDQLFETLSQTQPTQETLTELREKLKSSAANKEDLLRFKIAINQYIASHEEVKQTLERIIQTHSTNLNTAAEKNVLLYLLALGRSKFQLNTKRGYLSKQNHFTALCDYIQEKSPEGSKYQTFGLFKPNNAVSPLSEPEKPQGGNLLS